MIEKWEIVPDPHERFPGRHRVNVSGSQEDLRPLFDRFPKKTGKPWTPRKGPFSVSFYFYELTKADRAALEQLLSPRAAPPAAAPPPASFDWEGAAPDVEIVSKEPPAPKAPARETPRRSPDAPSLLESATDALMNYGGPSAPAAPESGPRGGFEPARPDEMPPALEDAGAPPGKIQISSSELGMPAEELILSKDPEPEVPAGHMFFRLAYFVPEDVVLSSERIHSLLTQTLESRRMPFVFHRVFTYSYRWPDRPLVDQAVRACKTHKVDALICVGEERRLELLLEQCQENGVRAHLLAREDAQKKYWRLGLITRIVVAEE